MVQTLGSLKKWAGGTPERITIPDSWGAIGKIIIWENQRAGDGEANGGGGIHSAAFSIE